MDGSETLESLIENLCETVQKNAKNRTDLLSHLQNLKEESADVAAHPSITKQLVDTITSIEWVGVAGPNGEEEASQTPLINGINGWLAEIYTPKKQHLCPLDVDELDRLLLWLQSQSLRPCTKDSAACSALAAIAALFSATSMQVGVYWHRLFHPKQTKLLCCFSAECCDRNDEFDVAVVQCLDTVLGCMIEAATLSSTLQLKDVQSEVCATAADALLRRLYTAGKPPCTDPAALYAFLLGALSLLNKIAVCCPRYAEVHVSELLGVAHAYMTCGVAIAAVPFPQPQRVCAAQQPLYDSAELDEPPEVAQARRSNGGKVSKTRKPRTRTLEQTPPRFSFPPIKTSDSDASESETANGAGVRLALPEHQRRAKLRLYALMLVGAVTRSLPRRQLYGYWHALFPTEPKGSSDAGNPGSGADDAGAVDLLHCAQHDPNARCRSAALQVASQILFNSKGFISQAHEIDEGERQTAFQPFSRALGRMVVAMYETLTAILAAEASLPVLTQALKCVAVLVQGTPFPKLQKSLRVDRFVRQVRRLVYHRDSTIQVSALMVMEFLVTAPDITSKISTAVGLPPEIKAKFTANGRELLKEIVDDLRKEDAGEEDERLEYEEEIGNEVSSENSTSPTSSTNSTTSSPPWLLLRVLHNLDGQQQQQQQGAQPTSPQQRASASVRIESLQLLAAMATHFTLLREHLPDVALTLQLSLEDALPDVRLYAARTLDRCAFQIGRQQVNDFSHTESDLAACDAFWASMQPVVMARISNGTETPALKVHLCDAFSNIGIVQFERFEHATQLQLFNFLSGVSSDPYEETSVRAAAVHALAVFVLFPSLRLNLVYVENAGELTLHLVKDANLLVRVKVIWSMGNISEALVCNWCARASSPDNVEFERISSDLLRRLITAVTFACSDNDKVRSNAVRTLGNLLRLLDATHFEDGDFRALFQRAISKLIDCVKRTGNAKVKWNSCYAIGQMLCSSALFEATQRYRDDMSSWQSALYPALCHIIVAHANFKVREGAAVAISKIANREYFGTHFEAFGAALFAAIEQSHQLESFYEYNHRDKLQEQLCLTVCHVINSATNEDFPALRKHLSTRLEVVRSIFGRVTNRILPERETPMLSCSMMLHRRLRDEQTTLTVEQRAALAFVAQVLKIE